jgi:hypothetical protein
MKVGSAGATKNMKQIIIHWSLKQLGNRCDIMGDSTGHTINEITGSENRIIPIPKGSRGLSKKSKCCLN